MCSPMLAPSKSANNAAKQPASKRSKQGTDALGRPMMKKREEPAEEENHTDSRSHAKCCRKVPTDITVRCPPVSSASDIRSRFLNRLGIQPSPPASALCKKNRSSRPSPLTLKAPLNDDEVSQCPTEFTSSSSVNSSVSSLRSTKTRSVSFEESVTVHPIPMRTEYSDRMKQQIWSDRQETYQNMARNSIEFASENWDWRQAAEEEDMILAVTGEMIHPIHYKRQCDMQRNFLVVMAARSQDCR